MDTSVRTNTTPVNTTGCAVSWSAIFAGALVAFSLSVLLNLLNTGLGLITFPSFLGAIATLSIGGYIWLLICGIVAMFIAGFVAGKVYRHFSTSSCGGALHGFLAWSLALLLSLVVVAHFLQAGAHTLAAAKETTSVNVDVADHTIDAQKTETAVTALGAVTTGVFFTFLLGAVAATFGGYIGSKRD
jgi:hypothetical protein